MLKFIQPGKITFNAPHRREKDMDELRREEFETSLLL